MGAGGVLSADRYRTTSKRKYTRRLVLLEFRDTDGISAKQIFDHAVRKIALFEMNNLRWKPQLLAQCDEIHICRNDAVPVLFRPSPNGPVIGLLQTNVADMDDLAIEFDQTRHKPGRQVFVEEQLHPRLALRPASAANW